eukprot:11166068-Lingulodinium_polyedra.AAC.1
MPARGRLFRGGLGGGLPQAALRPPLEALLAGAEAQRGAGSLREAQGAPPAGRRRQGLAHVARVGGEL